MAFDVYAAAAPNGSLLATLTDARDKRCAISLDGTGSGTFSLPRSSAQATAAIIAQGNLVKVRLTEVSANPIFSFWMETGRFDLVGSGESGSELLTFGGSGARSYLGRAIMWSSTFLAGETGPANGEWPLWDALNGSRAGAILRRLVAESIAGTRPQQPLPSLSFDFTYTLDSSGATWSTTPATDAFIAHVGDDLDAVVAALQQAVPSLVVQMDANLGLHAYNAFGVDRHSATFAAGKVRLQKAINIATALTRELAASKAKSHMLVSGEPSFYGSASNAVTPIREGFASSSGQDPTALNAIATSQLAMRSTNADSIRVGIPYGNTPTTTGMYYPGPVGSSGHYWVGDTITVHTGSGAHDYNESSQRIAEIAIGESEAGDVVVEVALGSTFSGSDFARIADVITEQRTDVQQLTNEALRYAHSLRAPQVVTSLPALPDPTFPLGSIVFLTTDAKLYRNADGSTWSRAVDGADVVAGTILAGALAVGSVTAQALAASIIIGGLIASDTSGRRWEADSAGIRCYDGTGALLVNMPTDGSDVYINAQILALSLTVTGNAVLRGAGNELASSSVTKLASSISNPPQAPALAASWDTITLPPNATYDTDATHYWREGLAYDSAGGAGGATKVFWTTSRKGSDSRVLELLASDRTVNRSVNLGPLDLSFHGITRHGTDIYVLYTASGSPVYTVKRYQASNLNLIATYTAISLIPTDVSGEGHLDIGSDGTNLYIVYKATADSQIRWNKYDATMVKQGATIDTGTTGDVRSATVSNADIGAFRVWAQDDVGAKVRSFDSTGVLQANEEFPTASASGGMGGITYGDALGDGARFWSMPSTKFNTDEVVLTKHSTWVWTTASPIYWVAYSWYDSAGTTHESQAGPRASITLGRRKKLTVTCAPLPGAGGADDPNNHRVYMLPNATDPGLTALKLQATMVADSVVLTTYASGGAADPGSNGFAALGTPAILQSAAGEWALKGTGLINRIGTAFPGGAVADDHYWRSDLDMEFYYDGTRWLCTCPHQDIYSGGDPIPLTASTSAQNYVANPGNAIGLDIWVVDVETTFYVLAGTALGASHKWVGLVKKVDTANADTTFATINIDSGASSAWRKLLVAVGAVVAQGTYYTTRLSWTKTGTPGNLYSQTVLRYRFVAT